MLCVGVIPGAARVPSAGEARFLNALCADPRFDVQIIDFAGQAPANLRALLRAQISLENLLIPPPQVALTAKTNAEPPSTYDVIVDFSHLSEAVPLASQARFGLWRLSAFAPDGGLSAALRGAPSTPVTLTRLAPGDPAPRLVAQTAYDTKFLAARNAAYIREKSVQLIQRELARLHRDGAPRDLGPAPAPDAAPKARQLPGYAARSVAEVGGRIWRKVATRAGLTPRRFQLRFGSGNLANFDPATAIARDTPKNRLWADPFLFEHKDQVFCFFEDFDYATGLGHIGVGALDGDTLRYIGPAHTAPHHLSYPFVFRHDGDIYLMPEAHQAGRLEIWKATDFPTGWELSATAFDGTHVADTALVQRQGDWWIFTNICNDSFGDFCSELHLFRTSGPDLKWVEPHPLNPVVIGSETARGGGRVHLVGDQMFRLSQDNSGGVYGYGLNVMQIETLTALEYAERRIRHITPDFDATLIGCHHFDSAAGRFVIDVRSP